MVEIDEEVVRVCREYLPSTACGLSDPRVRIHYEDGLKFIRDKVDAYDVILVDSTDPFGPGEGLFTREFYGSCYKALQKDGILVNQHESPFYDTYANPMRRAHRRIGEFFPVCRVYQAHIPTYPSGYWLFGFASKRFDPLVDPDFENWKSLGISTRYYPPELHCGSFALPAYVQTMLQEEE